MRYAKCVMKNPFEYGTLVNSKAFCNRTQELADIKRSIENGENLFLYSERRLGKTSLVQKVLAELPAEEYSPVYIDLWPTDGEMSFVGVFAKSITETFSSTPDKMLAFARKFFDSLAPSVSLDDQGKPQVTFGAVRREFSNYRIDHVLEVPAAAAEELNKNVVIVLDEFQQVLDYESDIVEKRLRSVMQKSDRVSYILLGSRKHLIQQMITDRSRPLYRSGGHYPLQPIANKHWKPFITKKFNESGKEISAEMIDYIYELTAGHPFYTQLLCHNVWEQTAKGAVTKNLINQSVTILLGREDYAYSSLWESLSVNQRRFLEALAHEVNQKEIFSASFVERYHLRTASTVQRSVTSLLERDLIDQDGGAYFITDRFFRLWLMKRMNKWFS